MGITLAESIGKKLILFIKVLFFVCVIHISIISFFDIMAVTNIWKINYPIIHPYFVWGIFLLPIIGVIFLFIKNYYVKLLGFSISVIGLIDICLFLKHTEGAL